MSIHHPLKTDKISSYSTLTADHPTAVEAEAGPRKLSVPPPEARAKWNARMDGWSPVKFEAVVTSSGPGVRQGDLVHKSAESITALVAGGKDAVTFPSGVDTIQLQVVVSYICCFRPVSGRFI